MRTAPTREERRTRTRAELVEAADALFSGQGFHATSVDQIADAAGYTKGAVYSNFDSKEDLFFAVYERRVDRRLEEIEQLIAAAATPKEAFEAVSASATRRSREHDGWLAVFFEFWAHVLRHSELRERFAELHGRVIDVYEAGIVRESESRGVRFAEDARKLATARYAMQLGLQIERLTQPDVVDEGLAVRMATISMEGDALDGLPDQAPSGPRARPARRQGARRA
jgi:AcrR family transcriptional regulator